MKSREIVRAQKNASAWFSLIAGRSRRSSKQWLFACFLSLASSNLLAQSGSEEYLSTQVGRPNFAAMEPVESGFINVANGNLHLEIPLVSLPQRGNSDFSLKLAYDSRIWSSDPSVTGQPAPRWFPDPHIATNYVPNSGSGGWRVVTNADFSATYETQFFDCDTGFGHYKEYGPWYLWEPDGTSRVFYVDYTDGMCNTGPTSASAYAYDGSGYYLEVDVAAGAIIHAKDGTEVWPGRQDANGNLFTVNMSVDPNYPSGGIINGVRTDSLGRQPYTKTTSGNVDYYDVPNSQGSTSRFVLTWTNISVNTHFLVSGVNEFSGTLRVLQSISLPNGTSYNFGYDAGNYGLLTSMTLPMGAQVVYNYTNFDDATSPCFNWQYSNRGRNRWLYSRTVAGNTWTYAPQITLAATCTPPFNQPAQQVTVAKPSGDNTVYTFAVSNDCALNRQADFYNQSVSPSNLLKSEVKDYQGSSCLAFPLRLTTIVPSSTGTNLQSKREYSFDLLKGNLTQIKEWNYYTGTPSATPDRQTDIGYLSGVGYDSAHIVDRVSSVVTRDSTGPILQTTYGYDSTPLASTAGSPAPQHDYGGHSSSNTVRGNVTAINRWLNPGNTWLTTMRTFDDLGNLRTSTDPLNNQTSFSYADNFTDGVNRNAQAYVTQTTYPVTNGVSHIERKQYDWNAGLVAASCGQNFPAGSACNNTYGAPQPDYATYSYDSMNRALTIAKGDGGQTSFSYNDGPPPTITTTTKINSSQNLITTKVFDGLGRITQTRLNSDPAGVDLVDTTYDSVGRVATVSNPYRSTTELTYGITQTQYDALNRVTNLIPPDGTASANNVSTDYSQFPTITVTDEAGKQRRSRTDAFGRLVEVDEPSASGLTSPWTTLHTYDGLGNLTCVEQHGDAATGTGCSASPSSDASSPWRVRRFTYDSLSRLLSSSNPEANTGLTGTPPAPTRVNTTYTYDANGNLLQKTSPAPNQTGLATQTISYCYDALNRVTGRAYSAQTCTNGQLPAGTAAVSHFYDQSSFNGLTISNGIGRLTGMSDAAGAVGYSYDRLGRIAAERRTINGVTNSMSYLYYLDGSVNTLTYPSGSVITYTPDGGGRTGLVQDVGHTINYVTGTGGPLTLASYAPIGAITGFVSGNSGSFAGIANSFSYNKRLQPISMSAASPTQTVFSIGYDFHLSAGDNGNVYALTNNKDHTRDQTFTYDQLNRLTSAQNAGTDCTITLPDTNSKFWGNSYSYDAWGNLLTKNITKCGSEFLSVVAQANNQLVGFGYDAAGNMTSAPLPTGGQATSIFDAENRMTTSSYGVTATYAYDGDGNRVEKSNGTTGTLYWYMTPGVVAETDLNGNLQSEYVFFNGSRIARKDFPSNAVSYYFSDHLKTTDIVTDAQGNILNESDYYPWGGELHFVASDSNHYKFTGKERDDNETGLDNFGARYNSNQLARFVTPDPLGGLKIDPQTLNKYSYVRNNPINLIDPTGLYTCKDQPDCKSQKDIKFEQARQQDLKSKDPDVVRAARAYGDPTKDNHVSVGFADLDKKGEGGVTVSTLGADDKGNFYANSDVTINSKVSGSDLNAAVGHEGSHVADAQDVAKSISIIDTAPYTKVGMDISRYASEQRAYAVSDSILRSENTSQKFACGLRDCVLGKDLTMRSQVPEVVDRILQNSPLYRSNGQPLSPKNQGGSVISGLPVPQ